MLKGFKYRLYPTAEQEVLLSKHFGAMRLLYNLALDTKRYVYKAYGISIGYHELATVQLKDLKAEFTFLKEVNSQSLQASLRNLDTAYQNFFKHGASFPNFKSKFHKQSFTVPQHFSVEKGCLYIPKFKEGIPIVLHHPLKGMMRSATISRTASGKYFASILCDTLEVAPVKLPVFEKTAVGIDLGLKSFIFCSDGQSWDAPQYLRKSEAKLKWLSRNHCRKVKGSKRREASRLKLARLHDKVANQRKDFLHKVSSAITKQYDTICLESLNVTGMMRNHCLAKSIGDAGWSEFERMVRYKEEWKGGSVLSIGTFEPSTKECNVCGILNHDLTLADREWDCSTCGTHHDRDMNAAIVIRNKCLKDFWLTERQCQDTEVSPLQGKRAEEVSKVQKDMLDSSSC